MANQLGIGIIGCGLMGGIHAAAYAADKRARVVACQNRTRSKAEALAATHRAAVCDSVGDLLARADIHAVSICSSQQAHCEQAVAALQAGKHVLCEKPLALTVPEMDAIAAAAAASGRTFMVAHQLRFHPVTEAVRAALPQLGAVFHLRLNCGFRISGHEGRCWMDYRSGGFFMELGCHLVDLARCLMGDVRHLSGHTLRINPKRVTEDFTQVLVQFRSGAIGEITVSANHRETRQGLFQGRVLGEKGRIEFTLYPYARAFNRATLILDAGKEVFIPDVTTTALPVRRPKSRSKTYPGFFDVYDREVSAFVDSVVNGTPPPVTLADGRAAIEGVLAAYASQGRITAAPNFPALAGVTVAGPDCHPLLLAKSGG